MAFSIPSIRYFITLCLISQSELFFRLSEASKDIGFKRQVFENVATEIECCKCKEKIRVNPFDMLNYVHGAKTMKDQVDKPSYLSGDSCPELDSTQIQVKLYFQRFINLLLNAAGLKDLNLDSGHKIVSMELNISHLDLKFMQEYATIGDGKLEKIDVVLSRIFRKKNVKIVHEGNGFFADFDIMYYSKIIWTMLVTLHFDYPLIFIAFFVSLVFVVTVRHMSRYSLFYSIVLMLLIIFCTGFGWNWLRMIKEEEAKIASTYALHLNKLPIHCRPHDMTWYQRLWYNSYEKDCAKYFKEISIDPVVRISPTLVLSETVSMTLLHPASKIGTAFGEFLAALIDSIPFAHKWYLVPLVLILLFLSAFFTYVVMIGGVVSFRTMLGSFEIGYRESRTRMPRIEEYQHRRQMIENVPNGEERERRRIEDERGRPNNGREGERTSENRREERGTPENRSGGEITIRNNEGRGRTSTTTTNLDQGGRIREEIREEERGERRRSGGGRVERVNGVREGGEFDEGGSGESPRRGIGGRGGKEFDEVGSGESPKNRGGTEKENKGGGEGSVGRLVGGEDEVGGGCEKERVGEERNEQNDRGGRRWGEEGEGGRNMRESGERRRDKVGGYDVRRTNREEDGESSVANNLGEENGGGEREEEDDDFNSNFSPRAFKELKDIYKRFRTIVASEDIRSDRNSSDISGVEELESTNKSETEDKKEEEEGGEENNKR